MTGNALLVDPPTIPWTPVATGAIGNFRRIKLRRITKFPHDLDHGALAALGRDARRGEQIDALLLVQRPDHDLELRIGEDSAQAEEARGERAGARNAKEKRVNRIGGDRQIAAAIAGGDRETGRPARRRALRRESRSGLTARAVPEVPPLAEDPLTANVEWP